MSKSPTSPSTSPISKERRGRDREERPEVSSDGKSILMQGEDGEMVS